MSQYSKINKALFPGVRGRHKSLLPTNSRKVGFLLPSDKDEAMAANIGIINLYVYVAHIDRRVDDGHDVPIPDLDGVIIATSEEQLESILLDRYEYRRMKQGLEPRSGTALEKYYDAGYYISRYDQTTIVNLCVK